MAAVHIPDEPDSIPARTAVAAILAAEHRDRRGMLLSLGYEPGGAYSVQRAIAEALVTKHDLLAIAERRATLPGPLLADLITTLAQVVQASNEGRPVSHPVAGRANELRMRLAALVPDVGIGEREAQVYARALEEVRS